jgi:hypothetical protein
VPREYDLLKRFLSDRVIAFHPGLARAFGGVYEALLFQQLAYWSDKGTDPEWIYKTREELREETTLNRYQQEQARASLKKLGVIREERRGLPARMYYKIEWDVVFRLLEADLPVGRRSTNLMADLDQQDGEEAPGQMADLRPSSKSTAENTSERSFRELERSVDKYDADRDVILNYIVDFAREFADQAPIASSVTRAQNLYRQSGLPLDRFVEVLYSARAITKERSAAVRGEIDSSGRKQRMAYFFSILEDQLTKESA